MDITPYVESLRRDLVAAAAAGSTEVRAAAERLAVTLDPAARLALMEAVSDAAAEITAALPSGGVAVRLDGRDLDFVVEHPAAPPASTAPSGPPVAETEPDGDVARVSLRLPESVKARAETSAASAGMSLNTWLVSVVRAATSAADRAMSADLDLTSRPGGRPDPHPTTTGSRRMTGWL